MAMTDQRQATMRGFMALYGLIVLGFIAIGPRVFASDWVSSSDFHACIEISSSFIALIAAMACLVHYFGQHRRFFLIVGLGFFVCGSEDLLHGIFGFKRLFAGSGVDFSRFIPGTYVAGRTVLAVMIIAAAVLEPLLERFKRLRWEAGIFSFVALAIGGGATALALTLSLPQFIYPEQIIARPVDFISALLYAVAFAVILRRFLSRRDVFTGSLLACILLNLGGQVYMSFSKQLFDVFFDVAHWANILSYCMPVAGITVEALGRMKTAECESAERQQAVDERVKELRAMYGVAESIRKRSALEDIFQDAAALLPPGWQYPEITRGRIHFDGQDYVSEPFERTRWSQTADIIVGGQRRGFVDVCYLAQRPDLDEGPFLKEERNLIDSIAHALSAAAERKQAEAAAAAYTVELEKSHRVAMGMMEDAEQARKVAEVAREELRSAHMQTESILMAIPSALIATDGDGEVTAWNGAAERVFGIEAGTALGRSLDDLNIEWDAAVVGKAMLRCRAEKRPVRIDEIRFKRPDATEGFLGITVNPVGVAEDEAGGCLLVAADITGPKLLQSQLAQAQKLESIGQLAAGIAHEINTPAQYVGDNTRFLQQNVQNMIAIVDRYAEMLNRDSGQRSWEERNAEIEAAIEELDIEYLREEIPRAIEQSLEGVERVTKIVRSMKEFSHPGGDTMQLADLNKAIESTATVARNEWKYVAELVVDLDPALPLVPCLLRDFNQVILNMIVNAAHAVTDVVGKDTGDKGTITISTRQEGDWAEIRISDTGTGIPPEIRAKVFDPFFTTKDVGQGTGQGLAIAHATVVKKHNGELRLESEVGTGTTFIIRLPIEPKSEQQTGSESHEEAYALR